MVELMNKFKKDISDLSIDKSLYDILSKAFNPVVERFSNYIDISYGNGKYGDYVCLNTTSKNHILIDITICDSTVDLYIGKTKSFMYMMDEIINEDDKNIFSESLNRLIFHSIREDIYSNGRIEFIDISDNQIFLSSRSIFSYLQRNKIIEQISYNPYLNA